MNHRGFVRGRTGPRGRRYLALLAMLAPAALALGCSDDAQRARTIIDDHSASEGPEVPEPEPAPGDPDAAVGSNPPLADGPGLLGSSHARSYMDVFCEGKADDEK